VFVLAVEDQNMVLAFEKDMIAYRADPAGFLTNVLGLPEQYVWSKMREIAHSVRDNQVTLVRAGHSVSKTFTSGRLVPWFKTCFQPSTVITSAPSDNQVRNQLWREIHAAYSGSRLPLGGKLTTLMWDVKPSNEVLATLAPESRERWEKNFAIGFSTSPDAATEHCTKMQGWHNEWLLVLLDEACGIMPQIWRTVMEGLIIDEQCRLLAIGNPTDPDCEFARACYSSDQTKQEGGETYVSDAGFTVITISVLDTPNYQQDRRVIPGLAGRDYVKRIVAKYGPDGDGTRIRVKGLFPKMKEGTYYGRQIAAAKEDGRVGEYPWDCTAPVVTYSDFGDMYTGTIFVQFIRDRIRIIDDYWDSQGLGIPAWCKMCQSKPYTYGGHICSPELQYGTSGRSQTGMSTLDIAAQLGFHLEPCPQHYLDQGIEMGRAIFGLLTIHKQQCGTFIRAISGYGKKKNDALSTDEETVYHDMPSKTWHRHLADAYRHLAIHYKYASIQGERVGSSKQDIPQRAGKPRPRYNDNPAKGLKALV
jgi:hypothetical protein